jgi:hypothetical protein
MARLSLTFFTGRLSRRKGEGRVRFIDNRIWRVRERRLQPEPLTLLLSPYIKGRGKQTKCNARMFTRARSTRCYRNASHKGKLRRAGGQARLRRSTELLLSLKIVNV